MITLMDTETGKTTAAEKTPPVLRRGDDGRLFLQTPEGPKAVSLRPCFPWSHADRYLSLRDRENRELGLIENLDDLDPESHRAVRASLREARFAFKVTGIVDIGSDFELRVWKVRTNEGDRTFLTKLEDWPRELHDGGLVLEDLAGDLYHIEKPDELDKASRDKLYAYRK